MLASMPRRKIVLWTGALALSVFAACAARPRWPASVVSAFAPTGQLRASINLGNPILARQDPASGQALGVGVELLTVDAAARSVDAVRSGRADIGFFAIDPLRGEGIRFTAPYVLIE